MVTPGTVVFIHVVQHCVFMYCCQLCGRAGRGGGTTWAHIFYNPKQKKMDKDVMGWCAGKENRGIGMLRVIGSTEIPGREGSSCDVCGQIPSHLCFESLGPCSTSKRGVAVREVDDELRKQLKKHLLAE